MFIAKWPRRRFILIAAPVLIILVIAAVALRSRRSPEPAQVPFSDLLSDLEHERVSDIVITGDLLSVKRIDGTAARTVAPPNYAATPGFVADLAQHHVRVEVGAASEPAAYGYIPLLFGLGFVVMLGFTLGRFSNAPCRRFST